MEIKAGWLTQVRQVPTKRFGKRPIGTDISLIVIHCISLPPKKFGGPYVDDIFIGCLNPNADPYFKDVANLKYPPIFLSIAKVSSLSMFPF